MSTAAEIKSERQKVYGEPRENHRGVANAWAGLLQPHWEAIRRGDPIPEWTVALLMVALKTNRMRRVYHADNFQDLRAYLDFAEEWQGDSEKVPEPPQPLRVYVAGPMTGDMKANTLMAAKCAAAIMRLGHMAHCPHTATFPIEEVGGVEYEQFMALDLDLIRNWATAVFRCPGASSGADREVALAKELGLPVYTALGELPNLTGVLRAADWLPFPFRRRAA